MARASKKKQRDALQYNRQRSQMIRELLSLRRGRPRLKTREAGWSSSVNNATLARWVRLLKFALIQSEIVSHERFDIGREQSQEETDERRNATGDYSHHR